MLQIFKDLTTVPPEAVDPASPVQRPALKSFETWVKLALGVAGLLMQVGIIADGTPLAKYIGAAFALAGFLGISVSRTALQINGNKVAGQLAQAALLSEAAKADPK